MADTLTVARCPFCARIERQEYEGKLNGVVWFAPLNPVTPGHMLFVPFQHYLDAAESPAGAGDVFEVAAIYARERRDNFNLIVNNGPAATQTVKHLHVHYVPRHYGDGLTLPWTGQAH